VMMHATEKNNNQKVKPNMQPTYAEGQNHDH